MLRRLWLGLGLKTVRKLDLTWWHVKKRRLSRLADADGDERIDGTHHTM